MVTSGAIDVAPQFQRRDRWNVDRQSALIESFVLNLPVPPIYLAEDSLGTFSVIDGRQRITAIHSYLNNGFALKNLPRFPELEGMRCEDLPRQIRNSLAIRPLRSVTLLRQSHEDLKYEVFHRLNTYGEVLNAQEIRNVIYRGPLNDLVYVLAGESFLRQQLKIRKPSDSAFANMQDAEWVLRFLTLRSVWSDFSGDLSKSMDGYMSENRELSEPDLEQLRSRFLRALQACSGIWGPNAFKRPDGDSWRDQALAGMYDAQMVAVDMLGDMDLSVAVERHCECVAAMREMFNDRDFDSAVRTGTNTPNRVKYRIGQLYRVLEGIAGSAG
jgi:hypothetical protein